MHVRGMLEWDAREEEGGRVHVYLLFYTLFYGQYICDVYYMSWRYVCC